MGFYPYFLSDRKYKTKQNKKPLCRPENRSFRIKNIYIYISLSFFGKLDLLPNLTEVAELLSFCLKLPLIGDNYAFLLEFKV